MITVGVCTLNRRESLLDALGHLVTQSLKDEEFELIVVDNGSTDGTVDALAELAAGDPRVRWFVEERRGQSHARNLLIAEARGDIIAFTDDDVLAAPGWLESVVSPLRTMPAVAATGGRVDLVFPSPRPRWLDDFHASYLAERRYGDASAIMTGAESPVGASMAVRTQVLRDLGGFSTDLGHVGRYPVGCEEYQLFLRLRDAGHEMYYVAAPSIGHQIPPSRMTRRYMAFRMLCTGVGHGTMRTLSEGSLTLRQLARALVFALRTVALQYKKRAVRQAWNQRSTRPLLNEYFRCCFEVGRVIGLLRGRRG